MIIETATNSSGLLLLPAARRSPGGTRKGPPSRANSASLRRTLSRTFSKGNLMASAPDSPMGAGGQVGLVVQVVVLVKQGWSVTCRVCG